MRVETILLELENDGIGVVVVRVRDLHGDGSGSTPLQALIDHPGGRDRRVSTREGSDSTR
jgi:hypothetical protein